MLFSHCFGRGSFALRFCRALLFSCLLFSWATFLVKVSQIGMSSKPLGTPSVSGSTLRRSRLATPLSSPSLSGAGDPFSLNHRPTVGAAGCDVPGAVTSGSATPTRRPHLTSAALFGTSSPRHQGRSEAAANVSSSTQGGCSSSSGEWRSSLLALEVRLRELAADGPTEPPTTSRIEEVLRLFDKFSLVVPPTYSESLRLFRVEFCRAIFSGVSGTGSTKSQFAGGTGEAAQVPFFDKIDKMLRERNILEAELEAVETDHNVADLKRQLAKLSSLIPFYEQEVGRLTRENERQQDDINRFRQDFDLTQSAHDRAFRNLEDEVRRVTAENRELQLQVFRLSKDNREQVSGQSMYLHMKQQKTDRLREMFSLGDENAGLQLMCHQLEHSLNGVMSEFDMEYTKCIPSEMASLRVKFNRRVSLILEEVHFCEFRLEQLQDPENVKTFSVLRASTLFELEMAKISPAADKAPHRSRSGSGAQLRGGTSKASSDVHSHQEASASGALGGSTVVDVQAKRQEWVKRFLGSVVESRDLLKIGTPHASTTTSTPATGSATAIVTKQSSHSQKSQIHEFPFHSFVPGHFLDKLFSRPMLDVSSNKFMIGIDVHAYAGGTSSHVRTMTYLDPTSLIDLPSRTSHVKLKFLNPMVRHTTVNPSEDEATQVQQDALASHLEWSPQNTKINPQGAAPHGTSCGVVSALRSGSEPVVGTPTGAPPDAASAGTSSDPAHWRLYRKMFRNYRPNLPRILEAHHVDFVMYQVCQRHAQRMSLRYELCRSGASQRSTNNQMTRVMADRLFRDEYQALTEFQVSLIEVLEARYSFPELVGKGLYEVLTSLEAMATSTTAPQAQQYLDCIGGVVGYSATFLTSAILHSVSSFWPASLHQPDQEVHQRDVLAVLRYVYPTDGPVRVDTDALIGELMLSCQEQLTLRATRSFLTHSVVQCDEGFVRRFKELFAYRADVVQWTELEFNDLFDTLKGFVGDDAAAAAVPSFLESCCVLQKTTRLPLQELSFIAAATVLGQSLRSKNL